MWFDTPKPAERCLGRFNDGDYKAEMLMIIRSDKGFTFRFIKGGDMSASFEKLWNHYSDAYDERVETD